jgi:hypothetical protein
MDKSQIEHLKMIQAIIGRMAQTSFLIKGWSVTLVTAMMALALSEKDKGYALLALFPALAFWGLDAFYLRQERLFRSLYERACTPSHELSPFCLSTALVRSQTPSWLRTLFAPTILAMHGIVIFLVTIVMYINKYIR